MSRQTVPCSCADGWQKLRAGSYVVAVILTSFELGVYVGGKEATRRFQGRRQTSDWVDEKEEDEEATRSKIKAAWMICALD